MPTTYERDCKVCGTHYKSQNKIYCSMKCRMQDRAWVDRMAETKRRLWASGHRQDISKFIKAGSDSTRGQPGRKGPENPMWKDEGISYAGIHKWMYREFGRPQKCDECQDTVYHRYEWANISGRYLRDRSDWIRLCVPCHRKRDGTQHPIGGVPKEFLR